MNLHVPEGFASVLDQSVDMGVEHVPSLGIAQRIDTATYFADGAQFTTERQPVPGL